MQPLSAINKLASWLSNSKFSVSAALPPVRPSGTTLKKTPCYGSRHPGDLGSGRETGVVP
jgi:hypothetical protein